MKNALTAKPLNQAQSMVLEVVKNHNNEHDLDELRELLLDFSNRKMQQHLDEIVAEKGYTATDFENMLSGHERITR
jgi:predicted lipid-binding transport protein (Tim44 family)